MGVSLSDFLLIYLSHEEARLFAEYIVDIDAHQYLYLLDLSKLRTELEVAGAAEIAHHRLKGMEVEHIAGYPLELLEEGMVGSVIEKLGAHPLLLRL